MKPEALLREAAATIEERGKLRDTPAGERSMKRAVEAFNSLLPGGQQLSEADGWIFMCCLKLARGTAGAPHIDDAADLAGYAALWGECYSAWNASAPVETGSKRRLGSHTLTCAWVINANERCDCGEYLRAKERRAEQPAKEP